MLDLSGKIAIVIGLGQTESDSDPGCWGIGAACAVQLARQGAVIFGGNRTIASTLKTQQAIKELSGQCFIQETDATSSTSVKSLVDACLKQHGRIDILVANVGYSQPGNAATMAEDVWDAQININLKTVYLACHHVLPVMEAQGRGAVVCVSSIAGLRYIGKDQIAYNSAKAGLMQFVKATAVSFASKGIRLNSVVPGLVETPYTRTMAERYPPPGGGGYEELRRLRDAQVPTGRMGNAWDVANAIMFLASDEARYITGQELVVDGGITSSTGRT
ncbi:hypothetical protein NLG97_g5254 [Lecanicillium saksenae]|uniref:Uncharacterized protein n=1 Tax=Lecanicillium saksenae TaxID=468837 RepID=A0ACC1QTI5_9HYPO|nr:hypothetical protein NLG97_g5254 [Lecanicillium saksenae]